MKFVTYQQYEEYLENSTSKAEKTSKQSNNSQNLYNNKKEINNRHDKIVRKILSRKKETVKFLNDFLNIEEKIEEENIEQCSTDFITKQYQNRQSDLVFKIKNKPIYFLIEHQSTIDENMPLRILEYICEIMRKEVKLQASISNKIKYIQ